MIEIPSTWPIIGVLFDIAYRLEPEPVVEVEEPEPTVDEGADIVEQKEELSYETADETAQRLIKVCQAGNAGICAALKTKYGIDMEPGGAVAEEPAEE